MQFASVTHCTHAPTCVLQYGAAPEQLVSAVHPTHTPRVGEQYGAIGLQFASLVHDAWQRFVVALHV